MPWEIKSDNGKFCVHKKGDPNPLKCYRNKARAEAYMRALYANSPEAKASLEFTGNSVTFDLSASEQDPRFLVFRNAILARAEVNANNDELFPEGIDELAKTLPGCPINDEHTDDFIGAFTAGRKTDDGALSTDGFIWADRWPDVVEQVRQGKKGLSIEANARKIKCTKCGQEFQTGEGKTCAHIVSTRAKRLHNARRQLSGMTAKGGATVLAPAGTGTRFGSELYMVANQGGDSNLICGYCEENIVPLEDGKCPECGIDVEAEITRREDVSNADRERASGEAENFADEKNKKYKLDTEEQIRAAWNYIHQAKNAAKYSAEEVAAIKRKIVAAWKSKISKEGPPSAQHEGAVEMTEDEKKAQEEAERKAKEEADVKAKEAELKAALEAEVTKLKAALDEAVQKLADAEKSLEAEKQARSALEARYTNKVLASVMDGEELTAAVEKAKGMTLDQVDLIASVAGKSGKPGKSNLGHLDLSGAAGNGTQPTKEKLTL